MSPTHLQIEYLDLCVQHADNVAQIQEINAKIATLQTKYNGSQTALHDAHQTVEALETGRHHAEATIRDLKAQLEATREENKRLNAMVVDLTKANRLQVEQQMAIQKHYIEGLESRLGALQIDASPSDKAPVTSAPAQHDSDPTEDQAEIPETDDCGSVSSGAEGRAPTGGRYGGRYGSRYGTR